MGAELIELRAHFGVSATDALGLPGARDPLPAWEYDLLVGAIRAHAEPDHADEDTDDNQVEFDPDEEPTDPPVPEALRAL